MIRDLYSTICSVHTKVIIWTKIQIKESRKPMTKFREHPKIQTILLSVPSLFMCTKILMMSVQALLKIRVRCTVETHESIRWKNLGVPKKTK